MSTPAPIDVVYTWVDGERPDYIELVNRHAARPRDLNPERYRDGLDTLRYSLRSIARFAPWVRHVYLFTCRPQAPAWLLQDHPRLRLVHHDEVMTEPEVLPTFNSNVIETFLHRLPGLSEHFLYFNDDYFLGAPVTRADFFATDGRMRVFGTLVGEHFRSRIRERQLVYLGALEHGPILIERRAWEDMQRAVADDIAALHRRRFRTPEDVRPERLYRWFLLTHARERAVAEPFWRYLPHAAFHKVMDKPRREAAALARIARRRPKFFCLNDDQGPRPHPEVGRLVRAFLENYFPEPGPFERG